MIRAPNVIVCYQCGEPCGRYHDMSGDIINGFDLPFAEGKGENFTCEGLWHCSEQCRFKTYSEKFLEIEEKS